MKRMTMNNYWLREKNKIYAETEWTSKFAKKQWETTSYNNVNTQLANKNEGVFKSLLNFRKQGSTINNRNSLTNTSQKI